eukprot:g436.t1
MTHLQTETMHQFLLRGANTPGPLDYVPKNVPYATSGGRFTSRERRFFDLNDYANGTARRILVDKRVGCIIAPKPKVKRRVDACDYPLSRKGRGKVATPNSPSGRTRSSSITSSIKADVDASAASNRIMFHRYANLTGQQTIHGRLFGDEQRRQRLLDTLTPKKTTSKATTQDRRRRGPRVVSKTPTGPPKHHYEQATESWTRHHEHLGSHANTDDMDDEELENRTFGALQHGLTHAEAAFFGSLHGGMNARTPAERGWTPNSARNEASHHHVHSRHGDGTLIEALHKLQASSYGFGHKHDYIKEFESIDKNHDGLLSLDEMTHAMRKLVVGISDAEIGAVFDAFDVDRSGSVDYKEFVKLLRSKDFAKIGKIAKSVKEQVARDAWTRRLTAGAKKSDDEAELPLPTPPDSSVASGGSSRRRRKIKVRDTRGAHNRRTSFVGATGRDANRRLSVTTGRGLRGARGPSRSPTGYQGRSRIDAYFAAHASENTRRVAPTESPTRRRSQLENHFAGTTEVWREHHKHLGATETNLNKMSDEEIENRATASFPGMNLSPDTARNFVGALRTSDIGTSSIAPKHRRKKPTHAHAFASRHGGGPLQEAVHKLQAAAFGYGHKRDFHREFENIDKDGDGTLSYSEMKHALSRMCALTKSQMRAVFSHFDRHCEGKIRYSDFVDVLTENPERHRQETISSGKKRVGGKKSRVVKTRKPAFGSSIPTGRHGVKKRSVWTSESFQSDLSTAVGAFRKRSLADVVALAEDTNASDSGVTRVYMNGSSSSSAEESAKCRKNALHIFVGSLKRSGLKRRFTESMRHLFEKFDADNNGTISFAEFREVLRDEACPVLDVRETRLLFESFDVDGNNTMAYDEFIRALEIVFAGDEEEDNGGHGADTPPGITIAPTLDDIAAAKSADGV